jgi:hypothetical protein
MRTRQALLGEQAAPRASVMMKITRVHSPSLKGDYFVEATDEATGERYRFCADRHGTSAVFRQQGRSWEQSIRRQRFRGSRGGSCA